MAAVNAQRYFLPVAAVVSVLLLAPYAGCHVVTSPPSALEMDQDFEEPRLDRAVNEPGAPQAPSSTAPSGHGLNDIERFLAE